MQCTSYDNQSEAADPGRARHNRPRLLSRWATMLLVVAGSVLANAPAPSQPLAQYEIRFMEEMIDHHAMAVQMATMCEAKAVHPELASLCTNIRTSQTQQIAMMQGWLADWYGVSYTPQMSTGDQQKMQRLADMPPEEFEVEFLKMMIRHHWKAVIRASQCVDRAYHTELVDLCQDIVIEQSMEIEVMRGWLCEWYGVCNYGPKGDPNA